MHCLEILSIFIGLKCSLSESFIFSRYIRDGGRNKIKSFSPLSSTAAPDDPFLIIPAKKDKSNESTFWTSIVRKDETEIDRRTLPCVPTLDRNGPLPLGAYTVHGDGKAYTNFSPFAKASCCIETAVDLTFQEIDQADAGTIVAGLHRFIDAGLNTFQLAPARVLPSGHQVKQQQQNSPYDTEIQEWGEENVFGRLRSQTPASVINDCHFTVPLHVSRVDDAVGSNTCLSIRRSILSSLSRTGGEIIDRVQLRLPKSTDGNVPCIPRLYFLDILDGLQELQREGLIGSVSACSLPPDLLMFATRDCGFSLTSNQRVTNLLSPPPSEYEASLYSNSRNGNSHAYASLIASSPLAGGLLTQNYYMDKESQGRKMLLTKPLENNQFALLQDWAKRWHDSTKDSKSKDSTRALTTSAAISMQAQTPTILRTFQAVVLSTLNEIARKHQVSIASVVLRWTLQLDFISSTVVSCRFPQIMHAGRKPREQELRQVFTFQLDEDDMERISELAGQGIRPNDVDSLGGGSAQELTDAMEGESGLFLPGLRNERQRRRDELTRSNRKIWL